MDKYSKIEWADATWSPVTGCSPVSEGCQNCYAERFAKRLAGRFGYPDDDPFRVTLHPERLEEPLRWRKPRWVFVNSMGDLFHSDVPDGFIAAVFNVMLSVPQHTFMLLTKRPMRMKEFLLTWYRNGSLPRHIWLGVTAENQARADERIPILLQIPAAVRFVSVEPMLGEIDISEWLEDGWYCENCECKVEPEDVTYTETHDIRQGGCGDYLEHFPGLNWIICGGETGPGARPMHPDWVRSLRDQCQASGIPFFFKSWGKYCYPSQMPEATYHALQEKYNLDIESPWRVGKKAAGRLLDGREWNEVPEKERVL